MKLKLAVWFIACLTISLLFFREVGMKLPYWLSVEGLQRQGVFHWGVLGLCVLWLWLKRKAILSEMRVVKPDFLFLLAGIVLLVLAIFLPGSDDFLVFLMLLGWLGLFTVFFSRACVIPSVLLAIYGFSVTFPILTIRWLGEPSAVLMTSTVAIISRALTLPIMGEGISLYFTSLTGDTVSTAMVPGCVGYATIGVFIALFSLMMLDIRLPFGKAWYVFPFGLLGTLLQNIVRLMITVVAGYLWGSGVMETVHHNISYVIFPLWYALFAYLYLKQAAGGRSSISEPPCYQ